MSTLDIFYKMEKPSIKQVSKPNYKLSFKDRRHNLHQGIWVDEIGTATKLKDIHSNYLLSLIISLDKKIKSNPTETKNKILSFNKQWLDKLKIELESRTDPLSKNNRVKLFLMEI